MKKTLFIIFVLALCLCLSTLCFAEDNDVVGAIQESPAMDVKTYITEKIVPVAVGVLTSAIAFLATLGTVSRSLKALKSTKDDFKDEAKERATFFESGVQTLEVMATEIKETVKDVPELEDKLTVLKNDVQALIDECKLLAEILSLGFSANSEIIKSGKGKKMNLLIEKLNEGSGSIVIDPYVGVKHESTV